MFEDQEENLYQEVKCALRMKFSFQTEESQDDKIAMDREDGK